jgi:DNA-binding MarR family transcriptional regulator
LPIGYALEVTTVRSTELFGDLLARARRSWVREMAERLERRGYPDYRGSDALVLRALRRGPVAVGRLTAALGVSRQAARKVVDGLEGRGYARTERDGLDARRLNVMLTARGTAYANAVVASVASLNRDFSAHVDPARMDAAREVLHEVLARYSPSVLADVAAPARAQ